MGKARTKNHSVTHSSTERILISCAGVGMGNASRVAAVIEALNEMSLEKKRPMSFHVVTWGSAYTFLREFQRESAVSFELIEAHSYGPPQHILNFSSLRSLFGFGRTFLKNLRFLRSIVTRVKPSLIVLDSDYHFPSYFGAGCQRLYIGQAKDVLERARRNAYKPADLRERLNFYFKERLDAVLQHWFSHAILVPSFTDAAAGAANRGGGKVRRIPLIVRREFLETAAGEANRQSVGILLSGSELEKAAFMELAVKFGLKVFSPRVSSVPSRANELDDFEVVFTQGGLSSISECLARDKFMVVFPLSHHPEQLLNAMEVERLGLGLASRLDDLERFPELLERIRQARRSDARVLCNGADVAAEIILETLNSARAEFVRPNSAQAELVGLHASEG